MVDLTTSYENLISEIQKYSDLTSDQQEKLREDETYSVLEVQVFENTNSEEKKIEVLESFGWPNIRVKHDTRYNWATRGWYRWGEEYTWKLTQDERDTYCEMNNLFFE